MSDHIPDVTKMIGETPRTDDRTIYNEHGEWVNSSFARLLENELNRSNEMFRKLHIHALNLNDRIRLMKEAGDVMESDLKSLRSMINDMTGLGTHENSGTEKWNKANE